MIPSHFLMTEQHPSTTLSLAREQEDREWLQMRRLKALSSLPRLRIIQALLVHTEGLCVLDLVKMLEPLRQPTVSHHLRILCDVDMLRFRKHGLYCYYYVRKEILASIQEDLARLLGPVQGMVRIEEEWESKQIAAPEA